MLTQKEIVYLLENTSTANWKQLNVLLDYFVPEKITKYDLKQSLISYYDKKNQIINQEH